MGSPNVAKLELTWERVFEVWWGVLWRFALFVVVPAVIGGFLVGAFSAFLFTPVVGQFFGMAVLIGGSAFLSVPLCKLILMTKFDGFSLGLLPEGSEPTPGKPDDGSSAAPPGPSREPKGHQ